MENKAKVKAEELIKKIKHVTMSWNIQEECYDASLEDQVKAAIIAVEEIMKTTFSRYKIWDKWKIIPQAESTTEFWQEVKEHLKKMK